mgnify:CR=1 FL=1
MAESKKAMEVRHARTLGKIAKEEAREAKAMKKGGVTSLAMKKVGRNLARAQNQKSGSK